jgi:Na+/H+-dicarboxylate symporter
MAKPGFKPPLHFRIILMMICGGLFGYFFTDFTRYTDWIGEIFLRSLNMIIIPLIFLSITTGVASLGRSSNLGRLGLKTIVYYLLSSLAAIIIGLAFVTAIKPGVGAEPGSAITVEGFNHELSGGFGNILIRIIPSNIFEALAQGQMLAVIFFSVLFGFFITRISDEPRRLLSGVLSASLDVIMKITLFIVKFTPLGIFSITAKLIAQQVLTGNEITFIIGKLGLYTLTVMAGISFHFLVTLSLAVKIIGRVNPLNHLKNMATPLLTAFSTSSSNATLPLTMEAVENRDGVSNKIASFTLPLGATINMDGTALYECVAAIFIAQVYGFNLSFTQLIVVVFTALLASIGAAGIPMAGLIMMSVVLKAVGLPLEGIGLVLAVDRILDMFRTATNVYSDSCGAVIIARSEGETLKI